MIKIISTLSRSNWGDSICRDIGEYMTGGDIEIVPPAHLSKHPDETLYTATGSLIQFLKCNNVVIWGVGFIRQYPEYLYKPLSVCSVRGKFSREILLKSGIECPEIYGDPALIFPKIYNPTGIRQEYELGIIPHNVDFENELLNKFRDDTRIRIISLNRSKDGNLSFIDDLLTCKKIVSSSLHGLVAADAYGIPSMWIKISDLVLGDGFKFFDYFSSVKRSDERPLIITEDTTYQNLIDIFYPYKINIDIDSIIESCPYNSIK